MTRGSHRCDLPGYRNVYGGRVKPASSGLPTPRERHAEGVALTRSGEAGARPLVIRGNPRPISVAGSHSALGMHEMAFEMGHTVSNSDFSDRRVAVRQQPKSPNQDSARAIQR